MTKTELNDILWDYRKWIKWLVPIAAFLIYTNTLHHQMALDDYSVIETHTHVQNGLKGIGKILTTNYRNGNGGFNDGLYRPFSLVSFALEKEFFDSNTTLAHLFNCLLYAFACFVLYLALQKLFVHKPLIIPLSITLLFLSHPLHTEVVANIKGRDELLAFLGFSLCLLYSIQAVDSKKLLHSVCSIFFFVIALFSKESAVSYALAIPVLLLLKPELTIKKAFTQFLLLLPFALAFIGLRYQIVSGMPNAIDPGNFSLLNNPIAAATDPSLKWGSTFALQITFLLKIFFPIELIHDYSYQQLPLVKLFSIPSILGIIILISLSLLSVSGIVRRNIFGIIAAFYLISIVLSSQLLTTIGVQFAERMLFLTVLAFALFLPLITDRVLSKNNASLHRKSQQTMGIVLLGVTVLFAVKTLNRNTAWENNFSLYQADIKSGSNSARVNYNLGTELNEQAKVTTNSEQKRQYLNLSVQYLTRAIEIYPEYLDAYNNLGLAYKNAKNYLLSSETFLKGIRQAPDYSKFYYNLATVYYEEKKHKKVITALSGFVQLKPDHAKAYYLMGESAGNLKDFDAAIEYLNQSLSIEPNNVNALNFIGMAYGMTGRQMEAEKVFEKAVNLSSGRIDILMNLALCYYNQGKTEEEQIVLRKILAIEPNNAMVKSRLR